jgi:uncharacterized protein YlxW (UPF0749 family)
MATADHDDQTVHYASPPSAQRWFLKRSRDRWKKKYMGQKADTKRLQNRVNDVTKSRAQWRQEAQELAERVQALQTENAILQEQLAALKKDRPSTDAGPGQR